MSPSLRRDTVEIDFDDLFMMPFGHGGRRPGTLGNHEFIALYLHLREEPVRYTEIQTKLRAWRGKPMGRGNRSWGVSYFTVPHWLDNKVKWRGTQPGEGYWWQPDIIKSFDSSWRPSFKCLKVSERGFRLTGRGLCLAAEAMGKVMLAKERRLARLAMMQSDEKGFSPYGRDAKVHDLTESDVEMLVGKSDGKLRTIECTWNQCDITIEIFDRFDGTWEIVGYPETMKWSDAVIALSTLGEIDLSKMLR